MFVRLKNRKSSEQEIKNVDGLQCVERPTGLPKKDPKEEQKHRKEYERIMAAFRKKMEEEKRGEVGRQRLLARKDTEVSEAADDWRELLLENWHLSRKKYIHKAYEGVPSHLRSAVWVKALGNMLSITQDLYQIHVSHSQLRLADPTHVPSPTPACARTDSLALIPLDIPRALPGLPFFKAEGLLHDTLARVLQAYVYFRPDIGYVQGMACIAGLLVMNMGEFDSFVALVDILHKPLFHHFFRVNPDKIAEVSVLFASLLAKEHDGLHGHFAALDFAPEMYLVNWLSTCFVKALHVEHAMRIFDVFVFLITSDASGGTFLLRVAMAILKLLHRDLLAAQSLEELSNLLLHIPQTAFSPDHLLKTVRSIKVPKKTAQQLEEILM